MVIFSRSFSTFSVVKGRGKDYPQMDAPHAGGRQITADYCRKNKLKCDFFEVVIDISSDHPCRDVACNVSTGGVMRDRLYKKGLCLVSSKK